MLRPDGWQQNWFSDVDTAGTRLVGVDHLGPIRHRAAAARTTSRSPATSSSARCRATIVHQSIRIEDDFGRLTRSIDFAPLPGPIDDRRCARRRRVARSVGRHAAAAARSRPAPRRLRRRRRHAVAAHRHALHARRGRPDDAEGQRRAVRRPPAARRAGVRPVSVAPRSDRSTARPARARRRTPTSRSRASLDLPRADGISLEIERKIRPGLEAQATVRARNGSRLPTVMVGPQRRRRGAGQRRDQRVPRVSGVGAAGVERRRAAVRQLRARLVARRVERLRLDVHQPRRAAARAERHRVARYLRRAAPAAGVGDVHAAGARS